MIKELLSRELVEMKVVFTTAEAQIAMEWDNGCGDHCNGKGACPSTPT